MREQVVQQYNATHFTALVKYRGYLCVAEMRRRDGQPLCPQCKCEREFKTTQTGWFECAECDFAILVSDLEKAGYEL